MTNFRSWISDTTPAHLHTVLGYREGTIRMWASRNSIPRAYWPDIQRAGLLTLDQLIAMERAGYDIS